MLTASLKSGQIRVSAYFAYWARFRRAVSCDGLKIVPVVKPEVTELGLSDTRGILQHDLKYSFQLAR